MRKNVWLALLLVMILPAMMMTVSCAKKDVAETETPMEPEEPMEAEVDEDAEMAAEKARAEADRLREETEAMARDTFINENVNNIFIATGVTHNKTIDHHIANIDDRLNDHVCHSFKSELLQK